MGCWGAPGKQSSEGREVGTVLIGNQVSRTFPISAT